MGLAAGERSLKSALQKAQEHERKGTSTMPIRQITSKQNIRTEHQNRTSERWAPNFEFSSRCQKASEMVQSSGVAQHAVRAIGRGEARAKRGGLAHSGYSILDCASRRRSQRRAARAREHMAQSLLGIFLICMNTICMRSRNRSLQRSGSVGTASPENNQTKPPLSLSFHVHFRDRDDSLM